MAGQGRLSRTAHHLVAEVAAHLPDAPIVVALSGGADSASLAWAVIESGHTVRAVSIDHGLPGSATLMDAARRTAELLGLEHAVVRGEARSGSETDLREARLAALESAVVDGEVIATGHTRDDQAETVLGNVLRGAGTAGLAGIPRRRDRWVRPLLGVGRDETRLVARELGLPFVDDPQNEDPSIRRNRLRSETIPGLAAAYNPGLVEALARLGRSASDDDAVLDARAGAVPIRRARDDVLVPAASLQMLPASVSARVASRALRVAGAEVDSRAVRAVVAAATGTRATIAPAIDVDRDGPWVVLSAGVPAVPEPVALDAGSGIDWGGWVFDVSDRPAVGRLAAAVDGDGPLVVRAPRAGDRISIGAGSKAVVDVLSEAGVTPRMRPGWPLVESGGTILWVAGVRAAPRSGGRQVTVRAVRRRT